MACHFKLVQELNREHCEQFESFYEAHREEGKSPIGIFIEKRKDPKMSKNKDWTGFNNVICAMIETYGYMLEYNFSYSYAASSLVLDFSSCT